ASRRPSLLPKINSLWPHSANASVRTTTTNSSSMRTSRRTQGVIGIGKSGPVRSRGQAQRHQKRHGVCAQTMHSLRFEECRFTRLYSPRQHTATVGSLQASPDATRRLATAVEAGASFQTGALEQADAVLETAQPRRPTRGVV